MITISFFTVIAMADTGSKTTQIKYVSESKRITAEINKLMSELADDDILSGYIIVKRDGVILTSQGWGFSNRGKNTFNSSTTEFGLQSISKPLTAIAILSLVQENKLLLNDTLDKWYPQFENADKISIRHLLTVLTS